MVIAIIGESCTGKSSIAEEISKRTGGKVFTGKDYMKMAKNEPEARKQFIDLLGQNEDSGDYFIFVITETDHLSFLPPKAIRILMTADLDVIKERFTNRLHGKLPQPVAAMLEEKHGMFDELENDLHIHNVGKNTSDIYDKIMALL